MKRIIVIFICILYQTIASNAQITYYVGEEISEADIKIKMSPEASFAEATIRIGEDVPFDDFTVGITNNRSEADFIIVKSTEADLRVKVSSCISFPDISLKVGEDVSFPDVTIQIERSGSVDYLIYSENVYLSRNEIIVALFPVINKKLDYKLQKLNAITYLLYPKVIEQNSALGTTSIEEPSEDLVEIYEGVKIFAQNTEKTYLGTITTSSNSESIYSEYHQYGSQYSSTSIWNEYNEFGSEYRESSAFCERASKPPVLVKDGEIIGYLTVKESFEGGVSPLVLKYLRKFFTE